MVTKLVTYFRAFQDSEEPPTGRGDIYLDLALQQKGVCRHRSFAFLVTALYLGIPTRMISNEAHARGSRSTTGTRGAASISAAPDAPCTIPSRPTFPTSLRPIRSPGRRARRAARTCRSRAPRQADAGARGPGAERPRARSRPRGRQRRERGRCHEAAGGMSGGGAPGGGGPRLCLRPVVLPAPDDRPPSSVTLMTLGGSDARRGAPLAIRGEVSAEGEPCGHVAVEVVLRSRAQGDVPVGVLATDERGNYAGALVLPATVPLGDYEAHARTLGDGRCGRGQTR
ncbi:MAG: hypothetical protein KIS78_16360 [Labilithrix sp.]|nr:hypothetical protein [Labilithrix sp.]